MIDYTLLDPAWLAAETSTNAFARGRRYAREGRARLGAVRADSAEILLFGDCLGSAATPYRQEVVITTTDHGDPMLDGACDCPVGFNCKHVVALVLTWFEQEMGATASTDRVAAWLAELDEGNHQTHESAQGDSAESLLYLLEHGQRVDGEAAIALMVCRKRTDDTWSKGRTVNIGTLDRAHYRGSYLRPIDRDAIDLLLVGGRNHWSQRPRVTGVTGRLALE
ncbi:MAG: SWIM zinc finger family protein, partial [Pseudomonadota bacterium]